jgi:hypothetical protein
MMAPVDTHESRRGHIAEFVTMPAEVVIVAGGVRVTFVPEGTLPELMGVKAAAAELGVRTSNIDTVAGLADLPVRVLDRGRVWAASDIRALAERRRAARG